MKRISKSLALVPMALALFLAPACDDGDFDDFADDVEDTAEDAADSVKDAAEDASDGVDDILDDVEDAADDVVDGQ